MQVSKPWVSWLRWKRQMWNLPIRFFGVMQNDEIKTTKINKQYHNQDWINKARTETIIRRVLNVTMWKIACMEMTENFRMGKLPSWMMPVRWHGCKVMIDFLGNTHKRQYEKPLGALTSRQGSMTYVVHLVLASRVKFHSLAQTYC